MIWVAAPAMSRPAMSGVRRHASPLRRLAITQEWPLHRRELVVETETKDVIVEGHSARPVDEARRRWIEIGGIAKVRVEVFGLDGEGMDASGFDADPRGPSPSRPVFRGYARAGLGGNDLRGGSGAAAGDVEHPALAHYSNAAAIGREPSFGGLREEARRGAEIPGGAPH